MCHRTSIISQRFCQCENRRMTKINERKRIIKEMDNRRSNKLNNLCTESKFPSLPLHLHTISSVFIQLLSSFSLIPSSTRVVLFANKQLVMCNARVISKFIWNMPSTNRFIKQTILKTAPPKSVARNGCHRLLILTLLAIRQHQHHHHHLYWDEWNALLLLLDPNILFGTSMPVYLFAYTMCFIWAGSCIYHAKTYSTNAMHTRFYSPQFIAFTLATFRNGRTN